MITEKDLIQFKKGKKRAFDKLYNAYSPGMYGVAMRYTRCEDNAQEIVQEAFIRVYQYREKFDLERSIGAWIKRITINCALTYLRKNSRLELELEEEFLESAEEIDEDIAENNLTQEKLLAALNDLPDGYRTVFNLFVLENLKHTEIAEYLNISVNTSKSQLSKAKKMLREILTKNQVAA